MSTIANVPNRRPSESWNPTRPGSCTRSVRSFARSAAVDSYSAVTQGHKMSPALWAVIAIVVISIIICVLVCSEVICDPATNVVEIDSRRSSRSYPTRSSAGSRSVWMT